MSLEYDVTMKPGDTVTVYKDPMSRHIEEGQAKLVEILEADGGRHNGMLIQRWNVVFKGEGDETLLPRTILIRRAII